MPGGGKINATHDPGREGELVSMRVAYSEPLVAWIFPRQVTHGSYSIHRVDGCARTRVVYVSSKFVVNVEKSKVTATQEQRTTLAGCTTTSTDRGAHYTAHFTAAGNPAACIHFSAFRRMRFTDSAVVCKV